MEEESMEDDILIPPTPDKQNSVKSVLLNKSTNNNSKGVSRMHFLADLNGIFYLNKSIESDSEAFDSTKISFGEQTTKTNDTFDIPALAHEDEFEENVRDKTEGSSVLTPEKKESRKRSNSGIDLNKKPRQKLKKHRPKILDDNQVKSKPKAKVSENLQPKTPVKKSTFKPRAKKMTNRKKNDSNVVFSEDMHITNKACRRALNMDLEVEDAKVQDVCNLAEDGTDLEKVDVCNSLEKDGYSDIQKFISIEKVEKNRFTKQYQRRKKRMDAALNLGSTNEPVMSTNANDCSSISTSLEPLLAKTVQDIPIYRKRRVMVRRQRVGRIWGTSKLSSCMMDPFVCMVNMRSTSLNWRKKRSDGCTQRRNYASGNIRFMCSQSPYVNLLQHLPEDKHNDDAFRNIRFMLSQLPSFNLLQHVPKDNYDSYAFRNIKFMGSQSPSFNLFQHLPKVRRANRMTYMQQRRQNSLKSVSQSEIVKMVKECFPQQQKDHVDSSISFLCGQVKSLSLSERHARHQQLILQVEEEKCQQLVIRNQYQDQNVQLSSYGQLVVPTSSAIVPHKGSTKKKNKIQVKVDLDEESQRVWMMIMSNGGNTFDKQAEEDPERKEYWNRERETTRSRVDSFLSILRGFQGNRRFTRWRGSVVDSVVGAYLTQNVSDYLSSTAFISLAAHFPLRQHLSTKNSGLKANISGGHQFISETSVTSDPVSKKKALQEITNAGDNQGHEREVTTQSQSCVSTTINQVNGESSASSEGVLRDEKTINGKNSSRSRGVSRSGRNKNDEKAKINWDNLRKIHSTGKVRNDDSRDAVDWEAVRKAKVGAVSEAIKDRGMNNVLAEEIKAFLERIVEDHGSIDLEWIRDVPPQDAKDFLLSINGIGLKSVECIRLLTLHHIAFPVDVNVGRIAVRLGWVPLQPLPGGLEMHLLNDYPMLDKIQKYLYPRLCSLDHHTLYELHYHMITFGKVFCTKIKPSCHVCPLQRQCKHYASLSASKRLALPAPPATNKPTDLACPKTLNQKSTEPIVEMPPSPQLPDIEDYYLPDLNDTPYASDYDPFEFDGHDEYNDDAPTITGDSNAYMDNNNISVDTSKSLVVADNHAQTNDMSLVVGKKNTTFRKPIKDRLRTIHLVFELPDNHPIVQAIGVDARDPDDPSPYLFTVWREVFDGMPHSKLRSYLSQDSNTVPPEVCLETVHRSMLNSPEEDRSPTISGTLMIPVRSANYGNFPLNGTYFQINEVFADHETSQKPMVVSKSMLYGLRRRLLFCGAHLTPTMKGLSIEHIHHAFSQGYFCNRGFNRETRFIEELSESFHVKTSNQSKTKRADVKAKKRPPKQRE